MITLSGRLYAVVRTESGQPLVITRKPDWKPSLWRPASQRDTVWVLAGLSAAVVH